MNLEDGLFTYLSSIASITNLLRANSTAPVRIFPDVAPQGTVAPYLTFGIVSDIPAMHARAASGLASCTIQIDVWATSSATRRTVADTLRNAANGAVNVMLGSVRVQSMALESADNSYEPPTNSSEVGYYRARMDFTIWYQETIPTLS